MYFMYDDESPTNGGVDLLELSDVTREGKWIKITAVADSGAVRNVMPEELVPFIKTRPTTESKSGKCFRGAGGDKIPIQGDKVIPIVTEEGDEGNSKWTVCPVKRPLISISHLSRLGNSVRLQEDNPHIRHIKTGKIRKLHKRGGVFEMDLWIKVPSSFDEDRMDLSSFRWQEQ